MLISCSNLYMCVPVSFLTRGFYRDAHIPAEHGYKVTAMTLPLSVVSFMASLRRRKVISSAFIYIVNVNHSVIGIHSTSN